MKIRSKLILVLLTIALIPTMLLSVVSYITISKEITSQTLTQLTNTATTQNQRINNVVRKDQEQVTALINSYEFNKALQAYLTAGTVAMREELIRIFDARIEDFPNIDSILVVDLNGKGVASTDTTDIGRQLEVREYTVDEGESARITLQTDSDDDINRLYIISTVSVNNKEAGSLIVRFALDDIVSVIQDYTGLGKTGETIVGQKGPDGHVTSLFSLRFDKEAALKVRLDDMQLFGKEDATYDRLVDYRKQPVFAVTRFIDFADWGMATKIDRSEVFGTINVLRNTILIIFGITAASIVVIAFFLARTFTRPITDLTERARLISLGNLGQRIEINSNNEIGALGATFNTMTEQLAASYASLERKVAERTTQLNQKMVELGSAKAKDDAMLGSIGEGMIVTDSVGNILRVNPVAAGLLGTEATDIVGKPASEAYVLYDDSDKPMPTDHRPIYMALQTGQKTIQTAKVVHKDGSKSSLGLTATPVIQDGKTIGAIQIIRDITKEKEVDRMKTEFISLASHQLRTPLSAIKWFSEMLISGDAGKLSKDQSEFATNIADSAERMIDLVNSLLNISRIESGRIIIDPKPTDLRELVAGIVNDLKGKTVEREQMLAVSVHNDLPKINIDPRLIGQVYLNLLTNAIKYTPKGGEITVFISRKGDDVVSQVTDNGYGIPLAEQGKMFQKFFRAANIAKVETDGTGLGMYLVKSIIESSGGKIWFKSEEGKGTTFWFSLPMSGMVAKAGEVSIGE